MKTTSKPTLEIADIISQYKDEYLLSHSLTNQQRKAINDIMACRTAEKGAHCRVCTQCGVIDQSFNSCRNRHCPKCQYSQKHKWLEQRKEELLPVKYFHLVFTLPDKLNHIFLFNKALCYNILFEATWQTIKHFSASTRWLGAETGCIAVLHTWGQNLSFHPHIHLIMPAGGLTEDGFEWLSTHKKFFAPVSEMSNKFKELFLKALLDKKMDLNLPVPWEEFKKLIDTLMAQKWVVFAGAKFSKPEYVIDYLGNYTHKIAISNHRLIKMENNEVYFSWKDYKQNGKKGIMKLGAIEFIHRFLEHVLPENFYKIRYFGIFANRFKVRNIANAKECLEREGKRLRKSKQQEAPAYTLPQQCPYMGPCRECGGATTSLYKIYLLELLKKEEDLKTG